MNQPADRDGENLALRSSGLGPAAIGGRVAGQGVFGPMRPAGRRSRIVDLVTARGSMRIGDLATALGVSLMTVHRDLDALAAQQLLAKVRGAATVLPSVLFESGVPVRLARQAREKDAIARAALKYVETGQAVMLDDSTTGVYLARLLPNRAPATVITNFLSVMRELSGKPGIRLIGLGGTYYDWADAFMGAMTIDAIRGLRADIVIMSTSAISDGILLPPVPGHDRLQEGNAGRRRIQGPVRGPHEVLPSGAPRAGTVDGL